MKKKLAYIFILMLVVIACVALLAACNDDEAGGEDDPVVNDDVTVTFNFGGEGQDVSLTGKAGDALAVPEAHDSANFYFGGWYAGADLMGDALDNDAVFPQKSAVYYAKWYVKYRIEALVEGLDGEYTHESEYDVEGISVKNATDSVTVTDFTPPEHHVLSAPCTVALTGRDNVGEVRFDLSPLKVRYVAGIRGVADVERDGKYGLAAESNVFGEQEGRRFIGWSDSEDGAYNVNEGDRLYADEQTTLYAVWATRYDDALGGYDSLYVAKGKSDNAYLSKTGMNDIEGKYDAATGTFAFGESESGMLTGKVLESKFFYFKDTYNRVFRSAIEGDQDTMRLKEGGKATYTDKSGKNIDGDYTVDEESGDFVFESEPLTCNFILIEPFLGIGDMTFRMKDAYEGYYAMKTDGGFGYTVIHFDGYGGAFEVWDPNRPYYNPYDDYEEIYFEGEYTMLEPSDGMPQAELDILRVPSYSIFETYTVRIDPQYTGTFGGVTISGAYLLKDSYEGSYRSAENEEDASKELVLDGYEYATYMGQKGTYFAERIQWYVFNGEYDSETDSRIYEIHSHSYIRFKGEDGKETILALDISDYNENNTYFAISPEQNVFEFENPTSFLYDAQGSLMLELWHQNAVVWESHSGENRVTYYTKLDEGEVTTLDDGWKHFAGNMQFDYKVTSTSEYTVRWRGSAAQLVFVDGELYIDEMGAGKYVKDGKPVTVDYNTDSGYVNLYHFVIDGKTRSFAERGGEIAEITGARVIPEGRSGGTLIVRLILLDGGRAIVGFRLSDGVSYAYLIDGNYSLVGEEYSFEYVGIEEGYEQALEEYMSFDFKISASGGDFVKNDGYDLTASGDGVTFTADGYGNATLSYDGGETLTGSYEFLEDVTVFVHDGGEVFLFIGGSGDARTLSVIGNETGYYYRISEGVVTNVSDYFFLDGRGGVEYACYDQTYGSFAISNGKYKALDKTDEDGYELYELTFGEDDIYMGGTHTVHVGFESTTDGRNVGTYWLEDPVRSGTYIAYVDGEAYGFITTQKGTALWIIDDEMTVGSLVRCDVLDGDIFTLYADGTRSVRENAQGKSLLFSHGNYGDEDYFEFVFDITDRTAQVDGVAYPIVEARMMDYGMFGRYDGKDTNEKIYLDGHGNMTVYDADGGVRDEGTVALKEEGGKIYTFTGGKSGFDFVISLRLGSTSYEMNRFEYVVYDAESDNVYLGDDLTALVLDGFGGGTLYDKYGMATTGTYSYLVSTIVRFDYSIVETLYFSLGEGTFKKISGDFISVDGVLYSYMGSALEIDIPGTITTIASGAFYGTNVTKINFAEVTRIEDDALSGLPLEQISSQKIKYVGDGAFADMGYSLKSVYLPAVEHIGNGAFFGDVSLQSVTLGAVKYIGSQAFTLSSGGETTLFDLRGAADLSGVEMEKDAIVEVDVDVNVLEGEPLGMRVLVGSVENVNALLAGETTREILGENAVICYGDEATSLEAAQTKFGIAFYAVSDGGLYILDGRVSKVVDIDSGKVTSFGLYSYSADGSDGSPQLKVYKKLDSGLYDVNAIDMNGNVISLNGDILLRIGDGVTHTFTDENGVQLTLSLSVSYDPFKGAVYGSTLSYGEANVSDCSVSGGAISFVSEGNQYGVRITSETKCEVVQTGEIVSLTSANKKFRLSVSLDASGKLLSCVMFEELYIGEYKERTITSVTPNADGTLTLSVSPLSFALRDDVITASYQNGTLMLTSSAVTYCSDDEGYRYGIGLTWDLETYSAVRCDVFSMEETEYEVVGFEAVSSKTIHITVDMNGDEITFEVEYTIEFGYAIRSIRQI